MLILVLSLICVIFLCRMTPDKAEDGFYQRVAHIPNAPPGMTAAAAVDGVIDRLNSKNHSPIVVIMRGLPGSGKSTIVQALKGRVSSEQIIVCSADHLIELRAKESGKSYADVWSKQLTAEAHKACQICFEQALANSVPLVVIDNTNIMTSWYENYIEKAKVSSYVPCIIELGCFSREQADRYFQRNSHDVKASSFYRMYNLWQPCPYTELDVFVIDQYDIGISSSLPDENLDDKVLLECSSNKISNSSNVTSSSNNAHFTCSGSNEPLHLKDVPQVVIDTPSNPIQTVSINSQLQDTSQRSMSPLCSINPNHVIYLGLFLTPEARATLCRSVTIQHTKVSFDHVTLIYKPSREQYINFPIGKRVKVHVLSNIYDKNAQALRVSLSRSPSEHSNTTNESYLMNEVYKNVQEDLSCPQLLDCQNEFPHITVSTATYVSTVYSNDLLRRAKEGIDETVVKEPFQEPLVVDATAGALIATALGMHVKILDSGALAEDINCSIPKPINKRPLYVFDFDNTLLLVPGKEEGSRFYWQVEICPVNGSFFLKKQTY